MEFLPDSGHAVPCESGEDHERRHAMRHRSVITARTTRRVAGWIPPCVRSADRSSAFRSAVLRHRRRRLARVVLHLRRLLPFPRAPQPPRRHEGGTPRGHRAAHGAVARFPTRTPRRVHDGIPFERLWRADCRSFSERPRALAVRRRLRKCRRSGWLPPAACGLRC